MAWTIAHNAGLDGPGRAGFTATFDSGGFFGVALNVPGSVVGTGVSTLSSHTQNHPATFASSIPGAPGTYDLDLLAPNGSGGWNLIDDVQVVIS